MAHALNGFGLFAVVLITAFVLWITFECAWAHWRSKRYERDW